MLSDFVCACAEKKLVEEMKIQTRPLSIFHSPPPRCYRGTYLLHPTKMFTIKDTVIVNEHDHSSHELNLEDRLRGMSSS